MRCRLPSTACALAFVALLSPGVARAQSALLDEYIAAAQLARAGQAEASCARLGELALEHPTSIAVHRAWGSMAVPARRAAEVERALRERLRRSSNDWAAEVGLASLLRARGRRAEAWRLLTDAIEAGERDALLVPLLLDTAPGVEAALRFLGEEIERHPRDALLAALAIRVALATGRLPTARTTLDGALGRGLEHQELSFLDAVLSRAAGRERAACEGATLVGTIVGPELEVPELRVPRRVALARILLSCGRVEPARRVLAALGPVVSFPGDVALLPIARSAEAEFALARDDSLAALALLDETGGLDEQEETREAALAVKSAAYAQLGAIPREVRDAVLGPLPGGLALADRSVAMAALAADPAIPPARFATALDRLALRLEALGLVERAARARILAAWQRGEGDPSGARRELRLARTLVAGGPGELPIQTAAALVDARLARRAGDPAAALLVLEGISPGLAGVSGTLLAALRVEGAHAALQAGDAERARAESREGMLDVQEATRSGVRPAPEFEPLAGSADARAVELAGLLFRAALALDRPLPDAAGGFIHNLGRAARGWSLLDIPWPKEVLLVVPQIPRNACAVFAATGEGAPALAIDGEGRLAATTLGAAASSPPCAAAVAIYWAGPAPAPGGLTPGPGDRRLLLRWVSPIAPPVAPGPTEGRPTEPPASVGPGGERPLRARVESIGGASPSAGTGDGGAAGPGRTTLARRPVFGGAGLAPSRAPFSSGWLVPPGFLRTEGWIGPETLQGLGPPLGEGLAALGLRAVPGGGEPESGLWMLADAAMQAGWRWALLTRTPLTAEEYERLLARWPEWLENPYREVIRLAESSPATADKLTLWTAPGPGSARLRTTRSFGIALAISGAAAIAGALLWGLAASRRRARRTQPTGEGSEY